MDKSSEVNKESLKNVNCTSKNTIKNIVKDELNTLVDPQYKEFHSKLCPGTNNILGVRVPILRKYAKDFSV